MVKRILFLLLLLAVLGGGSFFAYKNFIFRPTFPTLEEQSYLGSIDIGGQLHTFYIEKLEREKIVLLVLSLGEQAKTIEMKEAPRTLFSDISKRFFDKQAGKLYAPIEISVADTTYYLRGSATEELLQGKIDHETGEVGSWIAAPYQAETRFIQNRSEDLQAWLALERRKTLLNSRLDKLSKSSVNQEQEAEIYRKLLNSDVLRLKSENSKLELERELHLLNGQLSTAKEQISDLVDELALHARISHEGKAVLLARRVSRRENKWYLANWGESRTGDSEFAAAQRMGISLETLNRSARKAEEVRRLQLEILKERQKIEQLIKPPAEEQPLEDQQAPKKKRRKLFGIF